MYRVMIVDDEQLIRITMKNMIDWEEIDCSVLALAKDGEEAWVLYQQAHPEIVITDLKMPKMDGIELIKKIREDNANTQIIVLSNHSTFPLVKDAMKAGASDYLLKVTLEEDELRKAVLQVQERCKMESISSNKVHEALLEKLQHLLVLRKNEHEIQAEELHALLDADVFDPFRKGFQLAYYRVDNINLQYQKKDNLHENMRMNLEDIMKETIPQFMVSNIIHISNHSGVILFQTQEKLRCLNTCNSIMRNISQYLDMQLTITLSELHKDLHEFLPIYEMLLERHGMRFYIGEGILIQAEEIATFNRLQMENINFHIELMQVITSRDFSQIANIQVAFMMYMKEHYILPENVLDYVVFIFNNIEGNELSKGMKSPFPFHDIIQAIHECETIDTLNEIMMNAFRNVEIWLLDANSNLYRQDINEIIAYIEVNLTKKITLKEIAEIFNMNESYLSRMFKNETGKNLIFYINECKMKKAMELLANPKIMIKEAACGVGIEDQFYFNKVFKKFCGVSPSDYRRRINTKEDMKESGS